MLKCEVLPTYTYIKGQGWVVRTENHSGLIPPPVDSNIELTINDLPHSPSDRYVLMYKPVGLPGRETWRNVDHRNAQFSATGIIKRLRESYGMRSAYKEWQYRILPAEEEDTWDGRSEP